MANQKINDELSLEQLEDVNGGRHLQKIASFKVRQHQFLPPTDAEFGLKIPDGKCSLAEIIGPDGECIPAPEL